LKMRNLLSRRVHILWLVLSIVETFILISIFVTQSSTDQAATSPAATPIPATAQPTVLALRPAASPIPATVGVATQPTLVATAVASQTSTVVVPTSTPTLTQTPLPPTVTPSSTPTSTATPTVTPTATLTPLPTTVPNTALKIPTPWVGKGGIELALKSGADQPHAFFDRVDVSFVVTNTGQATLNFAVPIGNFYIELSTGQRYMGLNPDKSRQVIQVNDLRPLGDQNQKDRQEFAIEGFQIDWKTFQAAKVNPQVTYYRIGVTNFSSGIDHSFWEVPLAH
jgi:hypothetical protein